jgi:hypothetical protein
MIHLEVLEDSEANVDIAQQALEPDSMYNNLGTWTMGMDEATFRLTDYDLCSTLGDQSPLSFLLW